MPKYTIRYRVEYETTIQCHPEDLEDKICDIDVPENDGSRYIEDTFDVFSIQDESGEEIL
jgi:hypothetical protein